MAKTVSGKEKSIIEVIQKMVREGETDKKIIQTLKDLGVESEQAKRLLLLGQANTFALLEAEIRKIVKTDLDRRGKETTDFIKARTVEVVKESQGKAVKELEKRIDERIQSFEANARKEQNIFINNARKKISELGTVIERISSDQIETQKQVDLIQADISEVKIKGISSAHRWVSSTLIGLGLAFCIVVLYLFVTKFGGVVSIDSVIITVAMALIGVTMMFVATLI